MTTAQEKAEQYVRSKCSELMELSFGCVCAGKYASDNNPDKYYYLTNSAKGVGISIKSGRKVNYAGTPMPDGSSSIQIIGHPIQLQHWLMVLQEKDPGISLVTSAHTGWAELYRWNGDTYPDATMEEMRVYFNLTTGQPATEADYQAFNDIVGI